MLPRSKTKITLGDWAFSCAAPKLWDNLQLDIRKGAFVALFKVLLKI